MFWLLIDSSQSHVRHILSKYGTRLFVLPCFLTVAFDSFLQFIGQSLFFIVFSSLPVQYIAYFAYIAIYCIYVHNNSVCEVFEIMLYGSILLKTTLKEINLVKNLPWMKNSHPIKKSDLNSAPTKYFWPKSNFRSLTRILTMTPSDRDKGWNQTTTGFYMAKLNKICYRVC